MPGSVTIDVRVIPRASRSEVVGLHDGALKVRLAAPPVDGAANAELIKLLAKKFGVAKSEVSSSAAKHRSVRGSRSITCHVRRSTPCSNEKSDLVYNRPL
jgi:uncharacterized protein (TIGR00251 family)